MSFALLARDATTSGVAVLGVDPPRERSVSTLERRIVEGTFLPDHIEHPIVLGQRLANKLGAGLGDPLLLYSVAYSLETAYEIFAVTGVVRLPDPELDRNLALITLADAQAFYVYGDRVSEVAILTEDADHAQGVTDALQIGLAATPGAEVHTWEELMPELVQIILLDDAGMYITVAVVVIVVGFGILNTILMAVLERRREFGVLLALGLKPWAVFRIVYLESLALSIVGLVIGLAISLPMLVYLEAHPMPLGAEMSGLMELFGAEPLLTWKLKPLNPIGSSITIIALAIGAALYPAIKASRGRPVDVLRSL
jgi:ABC-type lipoprotein release transport system permease subunit